MGDVSYDRRNWRFLYMVVLLRDAEEEEEDEEDEDEEEENVGMK